MRQRVGRDADTADHRVRQAIAARPSARHGEVVLADGPAADTGIGPHGEAGPVSYSYSRVEERWEIRLQPDGSARASVVVRREQHVSTDQRWRFVARRELPGAALRRTRRRIVAAGAALVALAAGAWGVWTAWPRTAAASHIVTLPVPAAQTVATPPPLLGPPPPAARDAAPSPPPRTPATQTVEHVPVLLPPPVKPEQARPAAPETAPRPAAPDNRPLDARAAVRAALSRAFASGEAEAWSENGLSGFVVVGPVELADGTSCRNTVILARGGDNGDQTVSHRRCQAADGSIAIRDVR